MNIGKLSVVLSASTAPFLKALDETRKLAGGWARSVGKTVASASPIGALAGLASSGGLGGLALMAFKSSSDRMMDMDTSAKKLGVSFGDMQTLMLAAGRSTGAMRQSVGALTDKLVGLRTGSLDAFRSFERLEAVSGMDISPDAQGLQAFDQTVTALSNIQDATTRAALGTDLFGQSWHELEDALKTGGLANAKSLAERFGMGANPDQLGAIRAVAESRKTLEAMKTGVMDQLTIAGAALGQSLMGAFDGSGLSLKNLGGYALQVGKMVGYGAATAVEAWKVLEVGFHGGMTALKLLGSVGLEAGAMLADSLGFVQEKLSFLNPLFEKIGEVASEAWNLAGEAVSYFLDRVHSLDDLWEVLIEGVTFWRDSAVEAFNTAVGWVDDLMSRLDFLAVGWDMLKGAVGSFVDAVLQGFGWVGEAISKLWEQVKGVFSYSGEGPMAEWANGLRDSAAAMRASAGESFGTAVEKAGQLGTSFGKVSPIIEEAQRRLDQFGKAAGKAADPLSSKLGSALQQSFNQMAAATKSPLETFQEQMAQIQKMAGAGLFKGQEGLQERFAQKAFQDFASGVNLPEPRFAGAATSGSKEAYSAIVTHQRGPGDNVPQLLQTLIKVAQEQLNAQRQVGKDLEGAIKDMEPAEGFDF